MIRGFVVLGVFGVLTAAAPRLAHANECNLYQTEVFGAELRVGCPVTVIALASEPVDLPTFTRAGQPVATTVTDDQLTLDVAFYHYIPDTCDLAESHENRTFNRHVITLDDIQPGERIAMNGTEMTVLAAGTCDPVEPWFACADPIRTCPDYDTDPMSSGDDTGCSASRHSPSLFVLGFAGLAIARRRRR